MGKANLDARELEQHGDRGAYEGDLEAAKVDYGRAIDSYIDTHDTQGAIRTCRKLLRVAPDLVPARFTLTCLLIADRKEQPAIAALADYVRAVQKAGTRSYAVPRLVLLGSVVQERALREPIGRSLLELGAVHAGETLLTQVAAAATGLWPPPDAPTRRDRLFRLVKL